MFKQTVLNARLHAQKSQKHQEVRRMVGNAVSDSYGRTKEQAVAMIFRKTWIPKPGPKGWPQLREWYDWARSVRQVENSHMCTLAKRYVFQDLAKTSTTVKSNHLP